MPTAARRPDQIAVVLAPARLGQLVDHELRQDDRPGLARLQRADVNVTADRDRVLMQHDPTLQELDVTDPQRGSIPPFRGVAVARTVFDGEMLEIEGLRLTAHATPGHTPGGTSWTWRSCEGSDCRIIFEGANKVGDFEIEWY